MTEATSDRRSSIVAPRECYLVTGALGCIGAWIVRTLVAQSTPVVVFDQATDVRRLRQIMSDDELATVKFVQGDVTDPGPVERAMDQHGITNVIHLAALQTPAAAANPLLGAHINVAGTVAVFEAARRRRDIVRHVAYASSIAMIVAGDVDPVSHRLEADAVPHPVTHYGVWKLANEGTARVTWLEGGVSSVGLRVPVIYGVGRDQGLTSDATKAVVAAVLGRRYRIGFGGRALLAYVDDAARTFVIASQTQLTGANVFNLGGTSLHMSEVVAAIERVLPESRGLITLEGPTLSFPDAWAVDGLAALGPVPLTPFAAAINQTAEILRGLARHGRLDPAEQGLPPA